MFDAFGPGVDGGGRSFKILEQRRAQPPFHLDSFHDQLVPVPSRFRLNQVHLELEPRELLVREVECEARRVPGDDLPMWALNRSSCRCDHRT